MRRRYIAVNIECSKILNEIDIYEVIFTNLLRLFGEYGASQADLSLIEYNPEKKLAVLRCSHKALDIVKASITTITEVANEKVAFRTIRVSGTLKSLRKTIN